MNAEQISKLEQLRRETQGFLDWQSAPERLRQFEAELKQQEDDKLLNETIAKLQETLELSLAEFQEGKDESDKKLVSILWTLRGIITDRKILSDQTREIVNVVRHLVYQELVRDGQMPDNDYDKKFELDTRASQRIMDLLNQPDSQFMRIESQGDMIIDAILTVIARVTNDLIVDSQPKTHSPFVLSPDGVHHIPIKEQL